MSASVLMNMLHIPIVSRKLVPRSRFLSRLVDGLTRPLTLISAPPGFGETALIGEWRNADESCDYPLVRLSLGNDDSDFDFLCTSSPRWRRSNTKSAIMQYLSQPPQPPPLKLLSPLSLTTLSNFKWQFLRIDFSVVNKEVESH